MDETLVDVDVLQVERTCQGKNCMDEPEGEAEDIHMYHRICGQPRASMSPKKNLKKTRSFRAKYVRTKADGGYPEAIVSERACEAQGRDARYTGRDEVPDGRALWLGIT